MTYPMIAERLFNTPLMLDLEKAEVILSVVAPRFDLSSGSLVDIDTAIGAGVRMQGGFGDPRMHDDGKIFGFAGGIAHLPAMGTLVRRTGSLDPQSGMTGLNALSAKHRAAMGDPDVEALLLEIDSHGGEPAVNDLSDQIFGARQSQGGKLTVAMVNGHAFSAGFALASAADVIFMTNFSRIGSIGVLAMHVDRSQELKEKGIIVTFIQAGARKTAGNPLEPIDATTKAEMQAEVNRIFEIFVASTVRNRPGLTDSGVRNQEAATFNAPQGLLHGLADGIATMDQVVAGLVGQLSSGGPVVPQIAAGAAP